MANRIVGNVVIIDSGTINLSLPTNVLVGAAALYGIDSTSRLIITYASSTLDSVIALANPNNSPNTVGVPLGGKGGGFWVADTLRVLSLVAGTGYLYLG